MPNRSQVLHAPSQADSLIEGAKLAELEANDRSRRKWQRISGPIWRSESTGRGGCAVQRPGLIGPHPIGGVWADAQFHDKVRTGTCFKPKVEADGVASAGQR